ncbi:hypothetical protein C5E51_35450 [Nocardia nova]|uniref:hypothetical protein n=1 Tax=Nocardia nova TaxID=37330 RepID=UPI000CEA3E3A|nr:hypothetical protein [Nocardia nova]PPJ00193.1 hypothetical protein C5E51_35450 [Nocardia nova]
MDPISIGLLLGLITKSAAGEAGKSAWKGLSQLARRAFGDETQAELALEKAQDHDEGARDLAGYLMSRAAADPDLADILRTWIDHTQQAATEEGVINTISGQAQIRGHAIQARDIGNITLGDLEQ